MKTVNLVGAFLLSMLAFCFSACQDDAEIILFSGSQWIDETGTCANRISSINLYLNGPETADIGIANGKGGYSAQSSDETIVTATVTNDRLLLSAHDAKGKATVTISDKKGNNVVLPVTVAYGVLSLPCMDPMFAVSVNDEILSSANDENKELLKAVNEALMPTYSFIQERDICVLQPDDINKSWIQSNGSFKLKAENGTIRAEGTYQTGHDSGLIADKEVTTFTFSYKDAGNADKQQKFYLQYSFKVQSTRSPAPAKFYWMQPVTDSPQLEGVSLPVGGKILYIVRTSISIIRPAE